MGRLIGNMSDVKSNVLLLLRERYADSRENC